MKGKGKKKRTCCVCDTELRNFEKGIVCTSCFERWARAFVADYIARQREGQQP